MALENDDLIVVQKSGGGELRKAKISDIKPDVAELWTEDSGKLYPTTLTNKVGIGTDSPSSILYVESSTPIVTFRDNQDNTANRFVINRYSFDDAGAAEIAVRRSSGGVAADSVMQFRVGGTGSSNEKMRIDGITGNVGIGTDAPSEKLDIRIGGNTSTPQPTVQWGRTTGAVTGVLGHGLDGSNGIYMDCPTGQSISFQTGSDEKVRISQDGNVGIGTDSPPVKLSVEGSGDATDANVSLSEYTAHIRTDSAFLNFGSVSGKPCLQSSGSGTAYSLLLNPFNGNVGIGTDSPANTLHVLSTTNTPVRFASTNRFSSILFSEVDINKGCFFGTDNGDFRFVTGGDQNGTGASVKVRIKEDGNVGIGTDSPAVALEISGTTSSSSRLRVTRSGASGELGVLDNDTFIAPLGSDGNNGGLRFYAGGGERARIVSSGNFGIGTDSPSEKLHLRSDSSALRIDSNKVGTDFNNAGILFGTPRNNTADNGTNAGRGALVNLGNGSPDNVHGTTWLLAASSGLNATSTDDEYKTKQCGLRLQSTGSLEHWANNNPRFVVTHTGKVGIGTDAPAEKLHVNGKVRANDYDLEALPALP